MFFFKTKSNFLLLFATFYIFSSCSLFTISTASESEAGNETSFTYHEGTGRGPKEWGKLNPDWRSCQEGKLQSPVDIVDKGVSVYPKLGKLKRDYKPAPAVVKNRGHDITVRWKEDAGKITINGTQYKLLQCHWHTPSEHTFNGKRHDLEIHAVHVNGRGEIAVIGILYKYGRPDPFLSRLFHHIKSIGEEDRDVGILNPGDIKFGSRKYYRYIGSLTVPPCTEGVIWTIVKKVRTVSREQVRALKNAVHDGLEENARPIQPLDGRTVLLYTPKQKRGF